MTSARIAAATALLMLAAACSSAEPNAAATTPEARDLPHGSEPFEIDPATFTTQIDNPFWPMPPGARWIYRETDETGAELTVVVTVSSETKEIANGVTAVVVRDTVSEDGDIVEDTFDWHAQDTHGNIWYLGEDTAEFEGGEIVSRGGSWEAGVDGALAGVALPADPADDMTYRQEYYAGEAEDNGEVLSVDEQVRVPAGHYTGALLTKDTNPLEPKVNEYKLYAPGVGLVLALGVSPGGDREELLRFTTVGAKAARAAGTTPLGEPYP